MYKQLLKYYGKHPLYAIFVNVIIGIGLGILLSRPLGVHPLRYGIALLLIGGAGKLYALLNKVK
jgi:F0F1-type ATP synthase assembly protein I